MALKLATCTISLFVVAYAAFTEPKRASGMQDVKYMNQKNDKQYMNQTKEHKYINNIYEENEKQYMSEKKGKPGVFTNCGDPKHKFTLTFSPTTIKVNTVLDVFVSFTPAAALSSGTLSVTLTVPGVPDPIYKQQVEFGCKDINPYVKGACPFAVGQPLKKYYKYKVPASAHTVDIPTGRYHLRAEVRNQFTDPFICGETDLTIINPQ